MIKHIIPNSFAGKIKKAPKELGLHRDTALDTENINSKRENDKDWIKKHV
jgi:hypothetical protein